MNIKAFRDKVWHYRRLAGQSQQDIARLLALSPSALSIKLNGLNNACLTRSEIRTIIVTLAEWEVITTYNEVLELLGFMDLDERTFSSQEWAVPPLNTLQKKVDLISAGKVESSLPTPNQVQLANISTPGLQDFSAKLPHNLPLRVTSFIGREQDLLLICKKIALPETRLLTLTGPGGVGKTRLAIEAGDRLVTQFGEGKVIFTDLTTIHHAKDFVFALAETLGLKESGKLPLLQVVEDYLAQWPLLLILDNFEHVMGAAPVVGVFLKKCPGLKVLVTSREVLNIYGEHQIIVAPLNLKLPESNYRTSPEAEVSCEAVTLFVQRAQAIQANFKLTSENQQIIFEICNRLDGIPLALELAAARLKLLTPQLLLTRLEQSLNILVGGTRDKQVRQISLKNTLDWSYNLLLPSEQQLLARLAVFGKGFDVEAIEQLYNLLQKQQSEVNLVETIFSLVNKSLLQVLENGSGLAQLETIREYGLEKLISSGEEVSVRQAHALYYLQIARQAAKELIGPNQVASLKKLDKEYINLRQALLWFTEAKEIEHQKLAVELGSSLWRFWYIRGYFSEGLYWLERVINLPGLDDTNTSPILFGWAELAKALGNYEQVKKLAKQSLAIYETITSEAGQNSIVLASLAAGAYKQLGQVADIEGNFADASAFLEQSLHNYQLLQDNLGIADVQSSLGNLAFTQADYLQAKRLYEISHQLYEAIGDKQGIARILNNLGNLYKQQGDYVSARKLQEKNLELRYELNDKKGLALGLVNLASIYVDQEQFEHARFLCSQSLQLCQELGDKRGTALALINLATIYTNLEQTREAGNLFSQSLKIYTELNNRQYIVKAMLGLAEVALLEKEYLASQLKLEESRQLCLDLDDRQLLGETFYYLGRLNEAQENYAVASNFYNEALALHRELNNLYEIELILGRLEQVNTFKVK